MYVGKNYKFNISDKQILCPRIMLKYIKTRNFKTAWIKNYLLIKFILLRDSASQISYLLKNFLKYTSFMYLTQRI